MKFSLPVGDTERHVLEYSSHHVLGSFSISVDGRTIIKQKRFFLRPSKENYSVEVGVQERLSVIIETELGTWGREIARVFVNGRLRQIFPKAKATRRDEPVEAYSGTAQE